MNGQKLKIEEGKWNKEKMRPRSPGYKFNGVNATKELIRIEGAFHEAWNYFRINGGLTTIKLREKFKEFLSVDNFSIITNDKPGFLEFFEQKKKEYEKANVNNWKGYNTTLTHLKSYFGKRKPEFEDIDTAFYELFNFHLIEEDLSVNTISNHWKHIKALMKKAQMLKYHNNLDYQHFKRVREETDTVYLSEQELQKIFDLKLKGYLDRARDYFLIGCYTGLRFSDWDQVSKAKIKQDMAIIRNSKTGEKSIIPIAPNVLRILSKYKKGVLPRKPSNQKMNIFIKDVVKKAKINDSVEINITKGGKRVSDTKPKYKLVSTHTARRSFATIMILNGKQPHVIMKITGHKSMESFEKYVKFDEIQAIINLKQSDTFKETFGKELSRFEKIAFDENHQKKLLLLLT